MTEEFYQPAGGSEVSLDDAVARNEKGIQQSAPELLEGRLPGYLEQRLLAATAPDGFSAYALGIHQAGARTVEEAREELAAHPVSMTVFMSFGRVLDGLLNRFRVISAGDESRMIGGIMTSGYYGPEIGRYVYAFPVEQSEVDTVGGIPRRVAEQPTYLEGDPRSPRDLLMTDTAGNYSDPADPIDYINPKYCAGFIDTDGIFHESPDFMATPTA